MTTKDDEKLLAAIMAEEDDVQLAHKIREYYRDADRADRTGRPYLYFHMGMLCGTIAKMKAAKP